jgi:hypothetical protein
MRFLVLVILGVLYAPQFVDAYVPQMVEQESLADITLIADPTLSQGFYGTLEGFPHTFEIHVPESFVFRVQLRTPNLSSNTNAISGIIIKEQKRGVKEITRLLGKDASWEVHTDTLSGTLYREGASFEQELEPGVYRIEVHTPDNTEKYVLMMGKYEDMTIGYFTLLGRIMDIQTFNERSVLWVVLSPYVYLPLLLFVLCGGVLWYIHRKRLAR